MFCVSFAGFLKIIAPGVGFQHEFSAQGSGFRTFFVPEEWKIRPFKKFPGGLPGEGEWSGLELTDT